MIPFRPIPQPAPRKKLKLSTKLAACLSRMTGPDGGPLVPGAETMTEKQILAAVQWDHGIARELMGSDHPSNIFPLPVKFHVQVKTPADQKRIAKARHLRKDELRRRAVLEAKSTGDDLPRDVKRVRIRSRGFDKVHRPMNWRKRQASSSPSHR